jgi:hypothetical protein
MTIILAIVQYASAVITAILGVFGLLNDYKRDGRLTRAGRIALTGLVLAAMLGIAAKVIDQLVTAQRARLTSPFSDLIISWQVPQADLNLLGPKTNPIAGMPVNIDLVYVGTALAHGEMELAGFGGKWKLSLVLERPLGTLSRNYDESSPEFKAFTDSVQALIGNRFEIRTTGGKLVADLTARWPTDFAIRNGKLSVTLRSPSIAPLDLMREKIFVIQRGLRRPERISLSTTDPRVELNQDIQLTWRAHVLRTYEKSDETIMEVLEYHSDPREAVLSPRGRPTQG